MSEISSTPSQIRAEFEEAIADDDRVLMGSEGNDLRTALKTLTQEGPAEGEGAGVSGTRLVTLLQAVAERPWLTERLLRRLVFERRVPYYKPAGRLLFSLEELDSWADASRVAPVPSSLRLAPSPAQEGPPS